MLVYQRVDGTPPGKILIILHRSFELFPLLSQLLGQVRHRACSAWIDKFGAGHPEIGYSDSIRITATYYTDINILQVNILLMMN